MRRFCAPLVIGTLALSLTACGGDQRAGTDYDKVHIAELEAQVADQKAALAQKDAEIASLRSQLATAPQDDLAGVRDDLSGTGADVTWRNGELVISVSNEILFTSGSAKLTSKAKTSLRTIASTIKKRYANQYLRVDGHTDNQPIRRTKNKWEDNWHLAGARARAVLHELVERNGMPKDMVSFAGFADNRPIASNSSRSGRSQNRRVEIVVLPVAPPE